MGNQCIMKSFTFLVIQDEFSNIGWVLMFSGALNLSKLFSHLLNILKIYWNELHKDHSYPKRVSVIQRAPLQPLKVLGWKIPQRSNLYIAICWLLATAVSNGNRIHSQILIRFQLEIGILIEFTNDRNQMTSLSTQNPNKYQSTFTSLLETHLVIALIRRCPTWTYESSQWCIHDQYWNNPLKWGILTSPTLEVYSGVSSAPTDSFVKVVLNV